jgi:hypothetical protein
LQQLCDEFAHLTGPNEHRGVINYFAEDLAREFKGSRRYRYLSSPYTCFVSYPLGCSKCPRHDPT